MIATCTSCGALYEAGSQEQAYEAARFCGLTHCLQIPPFTCSAAASPAADEGAPVSADGNQGAGAPSLSSQVGGV